MRTRTRITVAVLLGLGTLTLVYRPAHSEDKPGAKGPEEDMATVMKRAIAMATPNEMHKNLEPLVGTWKTTTRIWFDAGAEPNVSTGTSEVKWMLGNRYVHETSTGTFQMPGPDGKMMNVDFEGHGVTGYDNMKQQYTFAWVDNMSTQLLTGLGTYDAASKTFTSYGKMDEPMTNEHGKMTKYVHKIETPDRHLFAIHDLSDGPDGRKVMEVTYERVK